MKPFTNLGSEFQDFFKLVEDVTLCEQKILGIIGKRLHNMFYQYTNVKFDLKAIKTTKSTRYTV